ncbi:hypothetical protein FRC14_002928 [Serendipita sp. 396]|nr:hypothetical protein FRC14_002928 [Serendipita sp. 396]KAG8861602.1 hypothetical protein FRB91_003725 [Serendipita sp. 411]KAG8867788.1 hypothetical protein FRC20_004884 [Serendipita sp. 405]KAG9058272.1 hypothetical protein FS842_011152 [Serendipita sp. 407]
MTSPTTAIKRSTSPSASLVASTNDLSSQQQQQQLPAQPPQQHGRASRPPPRSTFDLEPNPFEHSFSSTSAVSKDTPQQENSASTTSSGGNQSYISNPNGPNANGAPIDGDQSQNGVAAKDGEESKPMLPPLAALESPAGSAFGSWGLASSLRSGPLSPAMLAGPASQQTPSLGLAAFDSSFVRTGLTPDVGRTGLTPLLGGPGGYPPPSPNTAALFALVNGTSAGNGLANVPITPGTLSAIAGALNQPMGSLHQPGTMSLDPQNQSLLDSNQPQTMAPAQSQFGGHQPDAYTSHDSASHAITNAASALFLLSQQQSMQRHQNQAQQQQQVDPSAVSGNQQSLHQNPTSPITRRATKRKSTDVPLAAPPRGKKTKSNASVNTRGASRKKSAKADDMDEDGDDDEDEDDDEEYMEGFMQAPSTTTGARSGATKGMKKAETEEEKRKNFLERNRQGKDRCVPGQLPSFGFTADNCYRQLPSSVANAKRPG